MLTRCKLLRAGAGAVAASGLAATRAGAAEPHSLLVHVTVGPDNPTRAALAFLVARTAIEQGHSVTMFLAGDAVLLIRDASLDTVVGQGTGNLKESFNQFVGHGGRFYLSRASSAARNVTAAEIAGKQAEFATPGTLVELVFGHERVLVY